MAHCDGGDITENIVTTKEWANIMKVHPRTVMRWLREGMPHMKVNRLVRIDKDEALQWLKDKRVEG